MGKHENKHTPGPWRMESVGAEFEVLQSDGVRVLATCHVQAGEQTANARLIAAAPDLLAACERALAFVESMPDNDNVGLADCLRAAIAKAEGREP